MPERIEEPSLSFDQCGMLKLSFKHNSPLPAFIPLETPPLAILNFLVSVIVNSAHGKLRDEEVGLLLSICGINELEKMEQMELTSDGQLEFLKNTLTDIEGLKALGFKVTYIDSTCPFKNSNSPQFPGHTNPTIYRINRSEYCSLTIR